MINIQNLRLGFATNSSSSHSIVFFSDEECFKKIKQRLPFDSYTYYENFLSSIHYSDTNFIIKRKNLLKLYVLSQLANAIFRIVKNNDLTYKILYDITGEDLLSLIKSEFSIEKNDYIITNNDEGNFPSIDHESIWYLENLISLKYDKKTKEYKLENNDFLKNFIKEMISSILNDNVALVNHYQEYLSKEIGVDEKDLSKFINVEKN